MKTISIGPAAQIAAVLALVGALLAVIAANAPGLRRYLNVRSM
jgi:hypothetical protein